MNREIKFRAWDKICRKMFYDGELDNGDIIVIHLDGKIEISDEETYKPKDFILMQYTGIKDKKGKEIYEGDILEFDAKEWGSDKTNKSAVEWDGENGEWSCMGVYREWSEWCQVIGNVFENPELIKE